MTKAATTRKRIGKRIKDSKDSEANLYSLIRRLDTPTSIGVGVSAGGRAGTIAGGPYLPISGGTMIGPIAFFPKLVTISTGAIDIGEDTDDFSSRVIVSPESGNTDDLDTITGAKWAGQLLILQGVATNTITIKTTGNIETIDGTDWTLADDDNIIFVFDSTDNKWQQLTGGKQPVGIQDPIIVNENDLGTINGANNIDWSAANFHRCIVDGNTTFTMTNLPDAGKYQELVLEIKQDGTGGHTISFLDTFLNSHSPVVNTNANGVTTLAFYTYDDGTDRILGFNTNQLTSLSYALSDETTALSTTSTTVPITTFRMPYSMIITEVRTSLTNASTSGLVTVDVQESGTTILSTLCSIDANETTSTTAATPAVISDGSLADDAEIKVYLTAKGTNATGLKMSLIGYII